MKALILLIVLLVLPWGVQAGSFYDATMTDTTHWDVNAGYLTADAITLTTLTCDADSIHWWSPAPNKSKRDTTTHYVVRIDSSWIIGKIECDTIMTDCWTENDTTRCRGQEVPCDTTWRRELTFIWAPLVTVKLRPEQIEKLRELLK